MAKRQTRDIVIEMLTRWGEWESGIRRGGSLGAGSTLGRLIAGGPGVRMSAGPRIPIGVEIPGDVAKVQRLIAEMRARHPRAAAVYYQALRVRFVVSAMGSVRVDGVERALSKIAPHVLCRALDAVEEIYREKLLINCKKAGSVLVSSNQTA